MDHFEFQLGAAVRVVCSDEQGIVIARAMYSEADNSYLVRYKAADGRAVEAWWSEPALCEAPAASPHPLYDDIPF